MNKNDLITEVQSNCSCEDMTKKQAKECVELVLAAIDKGLNSDGLVQLIGFGSFKVVERKARIGRNPQTGKEIQIPASKTVRFSPSSSMKEAINN